MKINTFFTYNLVIAHLDELVYRHITQGSQEKQNQWEIPISLSLSLYKEIDYEEQARMIMAAETSQDLQVGGVIPV